MEDTVAGLKSELAALQARYQAEVESRRRLAGGHDSPDVPSRFKRLGSADSDGLPSTSELAAATKECARLQAQVQSLQTELAVYTVAKVSAAPNDAAPADLHHQLEVAELKVARATQQVTTTAFFFCREFIEASLIPICSCHYGSVHCNTDRSHLFWTSSRQPAISLLKPQPNSTKCTPRLPS